MHWPHETNPSSLDGMLQVCRWLELGLVVDWKEFPGFREAFDTGEVAWDVDPAPFRRRAGEIYRGKKFLNPRELRSFAYYGDLNFRNPIALFLARHLGVCILEESCVRNVCEFGRAKFCGFKAFAFGFCRIKPHREAPGIPPCLSPWAISPFDVSNTLWAFADYKVSTPRAYTSSDSLTV